MSQLDLFGAPVAAPAPAFMPAVMAAPRRVVSQPMTSTAVSIERTGLAGSNAPAKTPKPPTDGMVRVGRLRFYPGRIQGHTVARVPDESVRYRERNYIISTREPGAVRLRIAKGDDSPAVTTLHASVAAAMEAAARVEATFSR